MRIDLKQYLRLTAPVGQFNWMPTPLLILIAVVVFLAVFSSWYVLGNSESGVIQLFGRHVRTTGPGGIHGKLPWPFETLTVVGTTQVHQMEVGYRTVGDAKEKKYKEIPDEAEMFTADMNLVQIDFTTQYQISDPASWLFRIENPQDVLRALAESSVRNVVGTTGFDEVVTTGRTAVSLGTKDIMQSLASQLGMGASLGQVNLQDAHPPVEVMKSFKDVQTAREDKERLIQEGSGYYNAKIPEARAEAKRKIEAATGYKNRRIAEATGEANRFLGILAEYSQSPAITAQRMRFETLNVILPGKDQLIDLGGKDSSVLKFLNLTGTEASAPKPAK